LTDFAAHPGQAIVVHWVDSALASSGWSYEDIKPQPKKIETIGYVVDVGPEAVILTMARSNSGGVIAPLIIPTCCIREYHILDV
jgi:hypothetical protein